MFTKKQINDNVPICLNFVTNSYKKQETLEIAKNIYIVAFDINKKCLTLNGAINLIVGFKKKHARVCINLFSALQVIYKKNYNKICFTFSYKLNH